MTDEAPRPRSGPGALLYEIGREQWFGPRDGPDAPARFHTGPPEPGQAWTAGPQGEGQDEAPAGIALWPDLTMTVTVSPRRALVIAAMLVREALVTIWRHGDSVTFELGNDE
jgi:hypothetical protein